MHDAPPETEDGWAHRDLLEAHDAVSLGVLRCIVHEMGSPLAAVTTNASMALDLVEQLRADLGDSERLSDLSAMLTDVVGASENLRSVAADAREYARGGGQPAPADELLLRALRLAKTTVRRHVRVETALAPGSDTLRLDTGVVRALARLVIALAQDVDANASPKPLLSVTFSIAPRPCIDLRVSPHPGLSRPRRAVADLCLERIGGGEPIRHEDDGIAARAWPEPVS